MTDYKIILGADVRDKVSRYQAHLAAEPAAAGNYLAEKLENQPPVAGMTFDEFLQVLLSTKKPRIFAESEIMGGCVDWNDDELSILGDIGVAVPVRVFDNGVWDPRDPRFARHEKPFSGELLFTAGALLQKNDDYAGLTPDENEIVKGGRIDMDAYKALVERRLLPLFIHANDQAKCEGVKALITLPAVGAGVFAGKFKGQMGAALDTALGAMLEKHQDRFDCLAAVYYAPFNESNDRDKMIGQTLYRVRVQGSGAGRSLLCAPQDYAESGDDFEACKLFKVVAWDHVSLPGNDFFADSRHTDDGVSAAATDVMRAITGVAGDYDAASGKYLPPSGMADWEDVVRRYNVELQTAGCVVVVGGASGNALAPKNAARPKF